MPPPDHTGIPTTPPPPPADSHGRLLIAEADPKTAEELRGYLAQAGYDVRPVHTGAAALDAVAADAPDLLLLGDVAGGLDVVRQLKAVGNSQLLPIVALAGAQPEQSLEAGADDFLTEPFHPAELLLRVKSLLRLCRMHQDLADNNRELQAAYETARESEAKYRALIQDAQDALFLIDPLTATILEASRRARELSSYGDDDLIGQPVTLLCPDGLRGRWPGLVATVLEAGRAGIEDGKLRCKGGEVIPVEIQASLASHHLGEPLIQALVRDLRPRQQLEAERAKSERLSAVVETAVTVNHEINNPLFVITSSVESLQRALLDVDSSVRDKLERINEACGRIQRFTQQLATVIAPVSKEYMPGMKMLDLQQSVPAPNESEP